LSTLTHPLSWDEMAWEADEETVLMQGFLLCFGAGNGTQDFVKAKQELYH
jgi:hypothetical protein